MNDKNLDKFLMRIKMELDLSTDKQSVSYITKKKDYLTLLELIKKFNYKSNLYKDYNFAVMSISRRKIIESLKGKGVIINIFIQDRDELIAELIDPHTKEALAEYIIFIKEDELFEVKIKRDLFTKEDINKMEKEIKRVVENDGIIIKNIYFLINI